MSDPCSEPFQWVHRSFDNEHRFIELASDGNLKICVFGTCVEMPLRNWIRLATERIDESKHIDAMMDAMYWYFPPFEAMVVREKYQELLKERYG